MFANFLMSAGNKGNKGNKGEQECRVPCNDLHMFKLRRDRQALISDLGKIIQPLNYIKKNDFKTYLSDMSGPHGVLPNLDLESGLEVQNTCSDIYFMAR